MDIIPTMWSGNRQVYEPGCPEEQKIRVDAMLHLGMNFQSTWAVEKRARRDGYDWVGDDGVPLPKHNGGKGQRWEGLPDVLKPAFDVDKIVGGLQAVLPVLTCWPRPTTLTGTALTFLTQGTPTVISTDAGLMYCEFIFYSSLATLYRRNEMPRALFLHHAGKMSSPAGIAEGARVATSAICLMVDQIEAGDLLGTGV